MAAGDLWLAGSTPDGIYKSTDGGTTWGSIISGPTGQTSVQAIAVDARNGDLWLAGSTPDGIYKSTDGGTTWGSIISGPTGQDHLTGIAIDPRNGDLWVAGAGPDGLYKSTDGGATWGSIISVLPPGIAGPGLIDLRAVCIDSRNGALFILLAVTNQISARISPRIYKSTDGGANWGSGVNGPSLARSQQGTGVAIGPGNDDLWLSTIFPHGIYKSTDGGTTWGSIISGPTGQSLITDIHVELPKPTTLTATITGHTARTTGWAASYSTTLGGTATGTATYQWQWRAGTSGAWSDGSTTEGYSLTQVSAGTWQVRLQVTRGGVSATSNVITTVWSAPPTSVVANAGPDKTVESGGTVQIGGTDTVTNGVGPTIFLWQRGAGTGGSLSSTSIARPTFRAPTLNAGAANRIIRWRKFVINNNASDRDDVVVTVVAPTVPAEDVAVAGRSEIALSGRPTVTLDVAVPPSAHLPSSRFSVALAIRAALQVVQAGTVRVTGRHQGPLQAPTPTLDVKDQQEVPISGRGSVAIDGNAPVLDDGKPRVVGRAEIALQSPQPRLSSVRFAFSELPVKFTLEPRLPGFNSVGGWVSRRGVFPASALADASITQGQQVTIFPSFFSGLELDIGNNFTAGPEIASDIVSEAYMSITLQDGTVWYDGPFLDDSDPYALTESRPPSNDPIWASDTLSFCLYAPPTLEGRLQAELESNEPELQSFIAVDGRHESALQAPAPRLTESHALAGRTTIDLSRSVPTLTVTPPADVSVAGRGMAALDTEGELTHVAPDAVSPSGRATVALDAEATLEVVGAGDLSVSGRLTAALDGEATLSVAAPLQRRFAGRLEAALTRQTRVSLDVAPPSPVPVAGRADITLASEAVLDEIAAVYFGARSSHQLQTKQPVLDVMEPGAVHLPGSRHTSALAGEASLLVVEPREGQITGRATVPLAGEASTLQVTEPTAVEVAATVRIALAGDATLQATEPDAVAIAGRRRIRLRAPRRRLSVTGAGDIGVPGRHESALASNTPTLSVAAPDAGQVTGRGTIPLSSTGSLRVTEPTAVPFAGTISFALSDTQPVLDVMAPDAVHLPSARHTSALASNVPRLSILVPEAERVTGRVSFTFDGEASTLQVTEPTAVAVAGRASVQVSGQGRLQAQEPGSPRVSGEIAIPLSGEGTLQNTEPTGVPFAGTISFGFSQRATVTLDVTEPGAVHLAGSRHESALASNTPTLSVVGAGAEQVTGREEIGLAGEATLQITEPAAVAIAGSGRVRLRRPSRPRLSVTSPGDVELPDARLSVALGGEATLNVIPAVRVSGAAQIPLVGAAALTATPAGAVAVSGRTEVALSSDAPSLTETEPDSVAVSGRFTEALSGDGSLDSPSSVDVMARGSIALDGIGWWLSVTQAGEIALAGRGSIDLGTGAIVDLRVVPPAPVRVAAKADIRLEAPNPTLTVADRIRPAGKASIALAGSGELHVADGLEFAGRAEVALSAAAVELTVGGPADVAVSGRLLQRLSGRASVTLDVAMPPSAHLPGARAAIALESAAVTLQVENAAGIAVSGRAAVALSSGAAALDVSDPTVITGRADIELSSNLVVLNVLTLVDIVPGGGDRTAFGPGETLKADFDKPVEWYEFTLGRPFSSATPDETVVNIAPTDEVDLGLSAVSGVIGADGADADGLERVFAIVPDSYLTGQGLDLAMELWPDNEWTLDFVRTASTEARTRTLEVENDAGDKVTQSVEWMDGALLATEARPWLLRSTRPYAASLVEGDVVVDDNGDPSMWRKPQPQASYAASGHRYRELLCYKVYDLTVAPATVLAEFDALGTGNYGNVNFAADTAPVFPTGWTRQFPSAAEYDPETQAVYCTAATATDRSSESTGRFSEHEEVWRGARTDWDDPEICNGEGSINTIYGRFANEAAAVAAVAALNAENTNQGTANNRVFDGSDDGDALALYWLDHAGLVQGVRSVNGKIYQTVGRRGAHGRFWTWGPPEGLDPFNVSQHRASPVIYQKGTIGGAMPSRPVKGGTNVEQGGRYNFDDGTFDPPRGWSVAWPTFDPETEQVWCTQAQMDDDGGPVWEPDSDDYLDPRICERPGYLRTIWRRFADDPNVDTPKPADSAITESDQRPVPTDWFTSPAATGDEDDGVLYYSIGYRPPGDGTPKWEWTEPVRAEGQAGRNGIDGRYREAVHCLTALNQVPLNIDISREFTAGETVADETARIAATDDFLPTNQQLDETDDQGAVTRKTLVITDDPAPATDEQRRWVAYRRFNRTLDAWGWPNPSDTGDGFAQAGFSPWQEEPRAIPGQDGKDGNGYEYLFTSNATDAAIPAKEAPDIDWPFDKPMADGAPAVRGGRSWYDGTPTDVGPEKPWVRRAYRRALGSPAVGDARVAIGTTAGANQFQGGPWTIEAAYQQVGTAGTDGTDGKDALGVHDENITIYRRATTRPTTTHPDVSVSAVQLTPLTDDDLSQGASFEPPPEGTGDSSTGSFPPLPTGNSFLRRVYKNNATPNEIPWHASGGDNIYRQTTDTNTPRLAAGWQSAALTGANAFYADIYRTLVDLDGDDLYLWSSSVARPYVRGSVEGGGGTGLLYSAAGTYTPLLRIVPSTTLDPADVELVPIGGGRYRFTPWERATPHDGADGFAGAAGIGPRFAVTMGTALPDNNSEMRLRAGATTIASLTDANAATVDTIQVGISTGTEEPTVRRRKNYGGLTGYTVTVRDRNTNKKFADYEVTAESPATLVGTTRTVTLTVSPIEHELATAISGACIFGISRAEDGADGISAATVTIWKRAATEPTDAPANGAIYTYATGALSGTLNGWVAGTPPSGAARLWARVASVRGQTGTATIDASDWSGVVHDEGADGISTANVNLYQRANAQPSAPARKVRHTFATGANAWTGTGSQSGWNLTIGGTSTQTGDKLWIAHAAAAGDGATDDISSSEWSIGELAEKGEDAVSNADVTLYQRSDTQPSAPARSVRHTFATGSTAWTGTGSQSGWKVTIGGTATQSGAKMWIARAVAAGKGTSDVIGTSEWSIGELAEDGDDGDDGDPGVRGLSGYAESLSRATVAASAGAVNTNAEWHLSGSTANWSGTRTLTVGVSAAEEEALERIAIGGHATIYKDSDNWGDYRFRSAVSFAGTGAARRASISLASREAVGVPPSTGTIEFHFTLSGKAGVDGKPSFPGFGATLAMALRAPNKAGIDTRQEWWAGVTSTTAPTNMEGLRTVTRFALSHIQTRSSLAVQDRRVFLNDLDANLDRFTLFWARNRWAEFVITGEASETSAYVEFNVDFLEGEWPDNSLPAAATQMTVVFSRSNYALRSVPVRMYRGDEDSANPGANAMLNLATGAITGATTGWTTDRSSVTGTVYAIDATVFTRIETGLAPIAQSQWGTRYTFSESGTVDVGTLRTELISTDPFTSS